MRKDVVTYRLFQASAHQWGAHTVALILIIFLNLLQRIANILLELALFYFQISSIRKYKQHFQKKIFPVGNSDFT